MTAAAIFGKDTMIMLRGALKRTNKDNEVKILEIVKVSLLRKARAEKVMKVRTGLKMGVQVAKHVLEQARKRY